MIISFGCGVLNSVYQLKKKCKVHGLQTHDEFSTAQTQRETPAKCMKTLAFCRKNGLVMQNHGLGITVPKIT